MRKYFSQYVYNSTTSIGTCYILVTRVTYTEALNIAISKLQNIPEKCQNIKQHNVYLAKTNLTA